MDRQHSRSTVANERVVEIPRLAGTRRAPTAPDAETPKPHAPPRHWIEGLAHVIRLTHGGPASAVRTALACDIGPRERTLYLPPEMRTLQPCALRWLESFAGRTRFRIAVDRRQNRVSPLVEQRSGDMPLIGKGIAELMRQTGLPGPLARLSKPHRLLGDSPLIDLPRLIAMSAHAAPDAKQIVLLPNPQLVKMLSEDTRPIRGFACRLETRNGPTLLSHFDGPSLRCMGYSAGSQYVVHVLLAGGTLHAPALWTHPETLALTEPRFRLFRGRRPEQDFGLIYTTLYYDMQHHRPMPWWIRAERSVDELQATARSG